MIVLFKADVIHRGKEVIEGLQDLIWIGKEMKSKGGKKEEQVSGGQLFLMLVDSSVGQS